MKDWPENSGTISLEEAIKPLLDFIRNNSPYDGYSLCEPWVAHPALQPDHSLSSKGLIAHAEENRDKLEVVLGIAFKLGVIQGYRIYHAEMKVEEITPKKALGRPKKLK